MSDAVISQCDPTGHTLILYFLSHYFILIFFTPNSDYDRKFQEACNKLDALRLLSLLVFCNGNSR